MFKIEITETKSIKKTANKEWVIVGSKEVSRDVYFTEDKNEPKTRIENVYGWAPEIEKTVEESREILSQVVETLDLSKVIKAINGLE